MLHGKAQLVCKTPVGYQNHTDHGWTAMSHSMCGEAKSFAFDVPIVLYQASCA